MTDQTDRIKQMAQEAGFSVGSWPGRGEVITADHSIDVTEWLAKFAALVAEDEQARWAAVVKAMHEADEAYGCGFYNDDTWRANYMRLRDMAGLPKRD